MNSSIQERVSVEELMRHTEAIAQWVRLSGTADEAKAFAYIADELKRWGYEVTIHKSDALIGYPQDASLSVLGEDPFELHANGYSFSPATSDNGVTGEVLFVGTGMQEDYRNLDARGRIVVSEGLATPGKVLAAMDAGAIGQIHINDDLIHEMCISPVWGVPTPETSHLLPTVPSVAVTKSDGELLKQAVERQGIEVRLYTKPFLEWGELPTLIAELPGRDEDSYVLFSGHVDSWHYGAMDNGTANATQLEIARLLADSSQELRRGIRLAFWSGHSHSRYAGSAWYADTFWHDLNARCVCHVNVDSVGGIGADVLSEAPTMAETFEFAREILKEHAGTDLEYKRMGRFSDQSFWGHGIPSVFATFSQQPRTAVEASGSALDQLGGTGARGGGLGWWWHTTEDTLDKIDPERLNRDATVFAATIWALCTGEILPFNYAAAADEIRQALRSYQELIGTDLDLSRAISESTELSAEISKAVTSIHDSQGLNNLNRRLGHLLIPINYTASGRFDHDLALGSQSVPSLAEISRLSQLDPASSEYRFLATKIRRSLNWIEHSLMGARTCVRDAIE